MFKLVSKFYLLSLCLLTGLLFTQNVSAKDYSDLIKVNEEFNQASEEYITDLNGAKSADKVAKAIEEYTAKIKTIFPKMRALQEKYPEMKNAKNMPAELEKTKTRSESVAKRLGQAFMGIMKFVSDPKVQEAQKKLQAEMMKQAEAAS